MGAAVVPMVVAASVVVAIVVVGWAGKVGTMIPRLRSADAALNVPTVLILKVVVTVPVHGVVTMNPIDDAGLHVGWMRVRSAAVGTIGSVDEMLCVLRGKHIAIAITVTVTAVGTTHSTVDRTMGMHMDRTMSRTAVLRPPCGAIRAVHDRLLYPPTRHACV